MWIIVPMDKQSKDTFEITGYQAACALVTQLKATGNYEKVTRRFKCPNPGGQQIIVTATRSAA